MRRNSKAIGLPFGAMTAAMTAEHSHINDGPWLTEIKGNTSDTKEDQMKKKGLRKWPEYGGVWAATKKAAVKKFNKQNRNNDE